MEEISIKDKVVNKIKEYDSNEWESKKKEMFKK